MSCILTLLVAELSWTSAVCKSLYQDNSVLKTKHEALLSRLPISPSTSGIPSPSPSPLQHTPFLSVSASEPEFLNNSFSGTQRKRSFRHTRRVSVTPGELAQLADQNSELLNKLESLESEAEQADLAGKRKLKKLEREIQGLREELDRTQARSREIEEKAKRSVADPSQEAEARKKEREERVKVLRHRTESEAFGEPATPLRDFAPGGALATESRPRRALVHRHTSPVLPKTPAPTLKLCTKPGIHDSVPSAVLPDLGASSPFRFPSVSHSPLSASLDLEDAQLEGSPSREEQEYSVISQLLEKIQELEETNTQIASQQRDTGERLRAAQRDTESIRRLYDCLDDNPDVDLQIVIEDANQDPDALPDEAGQSPTKPGPTKSKTIRFKSLKRTIEGNLSRLMVTEKDPFFAKDIQRDMQSTVHGIAKNGVPPKARKTVVGLFESLESHSRDKSTGALSDLSLGIPSIPLADTQDPDGTTSSISFSPASLALMLEAYSTDSIASSSPPEPSPFSDLAMPAPDMLHSLGSELGSEYGPANEPWGINGENHHLRSTSLYDISQVSRFSNFSVPDDQPPSPSPMPRILSRAKEALQTRLTNGYATPTIACPTDSSSSASSPSTATSPVKEVLTRPQTLRNRRLSQTVRARRGRWAEGRFGLNVDANRRSEDHSKSSGSSTPTPTLATFKIMSAFDAVVHTITGRRASDIELEADLSADVFETSFEEDENEEANATALSIRAPLGSIAEYPEKRGVIEVAMELYLWIQFVLVILIFVYTMLKRGPRVLAEAERRKTHGRR